MIIGRGSLSSSQIRQRYLPDRDVWIFEADIRLDPAAVEIAKASARNQMIDRLHSLPAGAGVERRTRIRKSIKALDAGRVQQAILGCTKDFSVFKATTRERPDRTFSIPRGA